MTENTNAGQNLPHVDFAIGDSIAVGLNGAIGNHLVVNSTTAELGGLVIAKQGIGPTNVFTNIEALKSNLPNALNGKTIESPKLR